MAQDETYNGWTNYETWCVALWINNEQGWQEDVFSILRSIGEARGEDMDARMAGDYIRENVEQRVCLDFGREETMPASLSSDLVGRSLERVDWDEIGASFLADVAEQDSYENGEG